jgi:hypothetical protein
VLESVRPLLHNGRAGVDLHEAMKQPGETAQHAPATAVWPRRVLVGLWVLAFALAGGALATRWDALMARLARPPVAGDSGSGGLR